MGQLVCHFSFHSSTFSEKKKKLGEWWCLNYLTSALLLRLTSTEKSHKTELTKIKMKYDSKMKAMGEEVSTLTQHMTKYRRERDTYKEMLDGTQRTIAELKGSGNFKASRADNANEVRVM